MADGAIASPSSACPSIPRRFSRLPDRGQSVGRPQLASALLAAGHVQTRDDAFRRFLEFGGPAYVPRDGASPEDVIAVIHESNGLASVAHPGVSNRDHVLPRLAESGLDAIEVRHPDHDPETGTTLSATGARAGPSRDGRLGLSRRTGHRTAILGASRCPLRTTRRSPARDRAHDAAGAPNHERPQAVPRPAAAAGCAICRSTRVNASRSAASIKVRRKCSSISSRVRRFPTKARSSWRDTARQAIADGDEWLASLDRFGIVSPRAVLLDAATLLQNLAMPFTLEIDPIPAGVADRAAALGREAGIRRGSDERAHRAALARDPHSCASGPRGGARPGVC